MNIDTGVHCVLIAEESWGHTIHLKYQLLRSFHKRKLIPEAVFAIVDGRI